MAALLTGPGPRTGLRVITCHLSAGVSLAAVLADRSVDTTPPTCAKVRAAADRGDPDAQRAIDVYIHRLASGIASMSAATGGVDVLAFTGGVGERSAMVR